MLRDETSLRLLSNLFAMPGPLALLVLTAVPTLGVPGLTAVELSPARGRRAGQCSSSFASVEAVHTTAGGAG